MAITQQDKSLNNIIFELAHPQTTGNEKHEVELLYLDPEMFKDAFNTEYNAFTQNSLKCFFKHAYVYPSHHISHSWQHMTMNQTVRRCCSSCST